MVNATEREPARRDVESDGETTDNRRELMNLARNSENQESTKIEIAEKAVKEYQKIKETEKKIEKKVKKIEEESNPSESTKKKLEKAKRGKKKIAWRISVLEKEDSLIKALDSEAENEVKKKLGEELIKKEEIIRKEKERIDEEINRERDRNLDEFSETERNNWIEKVNRMESCQDRILKELNRNEFLTLFEFDKKEKEAVRRETIEDFKKEGAKYKVMKGEKGKFTGQRLEITEDQLKKARKEMKAATGERGKKIKKAFLSIFTSIGYLFGGLVGILWEGLKLWAGAKDTEKKKK